MFRFTTAGESHGKSLIAIVEGIPAGLDVNQEEINHQLWRRQQGYGRSSRMKTEEDRVEIISGIRHGKTIGSPVCLLIANKDFVNWREIMAVDMASQNTTNREVKRPRPGHADLVGGLKYNTHNLRDVLERASARETAARVAAGTLARIMLKNFGIEIISHVVKIGGIPSLPIPRKWEEIERVQDSTILRCADPNIEQEIIDLIDHTRNSGDTLGGTFEVLAKGVPIGLGSYTQWDMRLDGRIAQAIMSIQAVKAVEIGAGIDGSHKLGSQFHDEIGYSKDTSNFTRFTNNAGGLEGGITNGQELRIQGHMKPISTLRQPLKSINIETKEFMSAAFERSDITAVPAAGVVGEAMVALILATSVREKFGGDSMQEMNRNWNTYLEQLKNY